MPWAAQRHMESEKMREVADIIGARTKMAASVVFGKRENVIRIGGSKLIFGGIVDHFPVWLLEMVFILLIVRQISRIAVVFSGLESK